MKKSIVCVHLLNDYSGSPRVLATVVENLVAAGHEVSLVTCRGEGFLSGLAGVCYRFIPYRFFENKPLRLAMLLWGQVAMFRQTWRYRGETDAVYVNTLLPFGAALAGKMAGKRVIYHLHETTVNPPAFKRFLKKIARFCAAEAIYVSHFLQKQEPLQGVPSVIVHNCLPSDFWEKASAAQKRPSEKGGLFTVLMLCSLKEYKGVHEFVAMARALPQFRFLLVLNATSDEIRPFFKEKDLPGNLSIYPKRLDVHPFYQAAHLVVNLSHPVRWVETFGLTLLEAMAYGLPVVAPPVGGPVELVTDGVNGFKIDQRNFGELVACIKGLVENPALYQRLATNSRLFAEGYNEVLFAEKILQIVGGPLSNQVFLPADATLS